MVIDTSAILAIFFEEASARWVSERLVDYAPQLQMSTVNLAECLILIRDRQPTLFESLESQLLGSGIKFVPPTIDHSRLAARARLEFPLNLGDCFAYALAKYEGHPLLTLDSDFRTTDVELFIPPS